MTSPRLSRLYFGHLTLYDDEGLIYKIKNTQVSRALPEINQILQARGAGTTELVIREVKQ